MQSPSLFDILLDLGIDKESPEFLSTATTVIRYLIGVDGAYACQHNLKAAFDFKHTDTSAQKFRLYISDMSYLQLNLKFFCLHLLKHGVNNDRLQKGIEEFSLRRNDVVLVKKVLKQRGFRAEMQRSERLTSIQKDQVSLSAFRNVFSTFDRIYPAIMKHIKRRVYTKLRFISVSSNMEFYDLQMELMCKALQTYVKMVPTDKTELYITNYIRTTVSNHTTNMIKSYTTQKRKRMVQGAADGFGGYTYEIPVLSENQLLKTFGIEHPSYETMMGQGEIQDSTKHKEDSLNFQSVLKHFGKTKKRKAFICLMAGKESQVFTKYLMKTKKISPDKDNVDYSEEVDPETYLDTVCRYLKIRKWKAKRFLKYLAHEAYPDLVAER